MVQLHSLADAEAIRSWVDAGAKHAVVVGGGLIGLEAAENLRHCGLDVTVLEREKTILGMLDEEVSLWARNYLVELGMDVRTQTGVQAIEGETGVCRVVTDAGEVPADLVVWATGVRPNAALAMSAGIAIGTRGGITIDEQMRTSAPDVWAAGDCTETVLDVTGEPAWVAMGSVANKTGRVAGTNAAGVGLTERFGGVQNTCILKVLDASFGKTGLTERDAKALGIEYITVLVPSNDRAHYFPGHRQVFIKLVVESPSRRVVGAQVWGPGVVDKPLDVLATAIALRATVDQVSELDLAYAPPFSMAVGSVLLACNVAKNRMAGLIGGIGAADLQSLLESGSVTVLDVRTEPEHIIRAIPGSVNIPLEELEERFGEVPRDKLIVTVCRVGRRAYLAALALRNHGLNDISILNGGTDAYPYEMV